MKQYHSFISNGNKASANRANACIHTCLKRCRKTRCARFVPGFNSLIVWFSAFGAVDSAMSEETYQESFPDQTDPLVALSRTRPGFDEVPTLGHGPSDRTNPLLGWVRMVPVVEKYWHLVFTGLLREEQLNGAVRAADRAGADIEDALIQSYRVTPAQIGNALAHFYKCPYEPFDPGREKPEALFEHNPRQEYLLREGYVPIKELPDGRALVMALDPTERPGGNVLGKRTITYAVTTKKEFADTLSAFYNRQGPATIHSKADRWSSDEINQMITEAWRRGCSDIHIEARVRQGNTRVRLRKDGSLIPYLEVSIEHHQKLVNRLKHMCALDTTERRMPQDGKISFKNFGPADIELRVATIPTSGGYEDVVMRLLAAGFPIPLDRIEMSAENLSAIYDVTAMPYGLFLVCGPTGSGKTTTLHSILHRLNEPSRKIWTAEDPVEISHEGLCQVQINAEQGLTFASALRTFLRADPDVIMVGEMRDHETAAIAIEASLTGHLVLSTLHTNSAPETVTRLVEMSLDPYLIADALLGILAQRLTKRLCIKCRKPRAASEDELKILLNEYVMERERLERDRSASRTHDPALAERQLRESWMERFANKNGSIILHDTGGCEECSDTGYNGRIALHELLIVNDDIKAAIQGRALSSVVFNLAVAAGMRTLRQDGILKVLAGHTDLKQVHGACVR
jgi:type II secretory ATPase GspE/PulE/Tfp pilus assembly ATPase PilB-like protein